MIIDPPIKPMKQRWRVEPLTIYHSLLTIHPAMSEMTITLDNRDEALLLFGSRDQNLRAIRDALGVRLVARGDTVHVDGDEIKISQAERVFQQLRTMLRQQGRLSPEEVRSVLEVVQHAGDRQGPQTLGATDSGRHVRART